MTPENALPKLLKDLNPAEIAFMRRQLTGHDLLIFNQMLKKEKFEQEELGGKIKGMSENAFNVQKSILAGKISKMMGIYRRKGQPRQLLAEPRAMYEANAAAENVRRALTCCDDGIELAREMEEYMDAAEFCEGAVMMLPEGSPLAEPYKAQRNEFVRALNQWTQLQLLHDEITEAKSLAPAQRRDVGQRLLQRLDAIPAPQLPRLRLLYARIKGLCLIFLGRLDEARLELRTATHIVDGKTYLLTNLLTMNGVTALYMGLANFYATEGKLDQGMNLLQGFAGWVKESGHVLNPMVKSEIARLRIIEGINRGDYQSIDQLDEAKWKEMSRYWLPGRQGEVAFSFAWRLQEALEPRRAQRWIGIALDYRRDNMKPDVMWNLAVLQLICWYDRQEWDSLESAIRAAERIFQKLALVPGIERAVLAAFRSVMREPQGRYRAMLGLRDALEEATNGSEWPPEYYPLPDWVKSKLDLR